MELRPARTSRKLLTTYSHRRTRAKAAPVNSDARHSSPLELMSNDKEEITLEEMTYRMKKRSRHIGPLDSNRQAPVNENARDGKKARHLSPSHPGSAMFPDLVSPGETNDVASSEVFSLKPLASETQFCTPRPTLCSDQSMLPSSSVPAASTEQAELSPIPIGKRMLSRTSSRNLKENNIRGLASPFTSRPSSRTASPMSGVKKQMKAKARRPAFHSKSRTLSSAHVPTVVTENGRIISDTPLDFMNAMSTSQVKGHQQSISDTDGALKPVTSMHTRTGSIPTMPSTRVQASDTWLVHSKDFSRSTQNDADFEHASFYSGVPNEVSTPPRKRRATTGALPMQPNGHGAEFSASSHSRQTTNGEDADMQDISRPNSSVVRAFIGRPPPRRRRRTINHPTGDGLFSSVLDFSVHATDDNQPSSAGGFSEASTSGKPINEDLLAVTGEASQLSAQFLELNLGLASAFLPATDSAVNVPSLARSVSAPTVIPRQGNSFKEVSRSHSATDQLNADSDGDELRDLFSILGLDEDEKWSAASMFREREDGIGGPLLSSALPHSQTPNLSPQLTSRAVRSKEQTHRRKRGDTIRASDFARPPVSAGGVSASTNPKASDATSEVRSRRTRSGTVTLADFAASTSASRAAAERVRNEQSRPKPTSPVRTHKRNREGWPTIRMKIDEQPLLVASDDEDDDELLLKAGSTVD